MGSHAAADSSHGDSRTYGGTRDEALLNQLEQKLVKQGKVLPGTTPKGKLPKE